MNEKLIHIQSRLKAPKGNYNSFGKYKYRSCEDILEAVKPLLAEEGLTLTLSDEIEQIGDRYYVRATASLYENDNLIEIVSAYAREEDNKKGMDASQITGTASSYARKYALNGLFLIDDTKDADTDEYASQTAHEEYATTTEKKTLMRLCEDLNVDIADILNQVGVIDGKKMTSKQHAQALEILKKIEDGNNRKN
ncbi:ERF family protein [Roseburia hominis]|uniref:ERF family protein n=1 Tax=Roseburia hominis TaxID=301301 RepID=UPI00242F38F5|nr:ERF family protein [Roseburia hominis]